MAKSATFTVPDADGVEHTYLVNAHPAEEGIDLSLWFLAHLGGLFSGLLPALVSGGRKLLEEGGGTVSGVLDDPNAAARLFGVLADALGPDAGATVAREIRTALLAPSAKPMLLALFKYARRDGNPIIFTRDFQANYLEMYRSAWAIVQVNGFFGWRGTSKPAAG